MYLPPIARRVLESQFQLTEHYGPGEHPSGSPQEAHAGVDRAPAGGWTNYYNGEYYKGGQWMPSAPGAMPKGSGSKVRTAIRRTTAAVPDDQNIASLRIQKSGAGSAVRLRLAGEERERTSFIGTDDEATMFVRELVKLRADRNQAAGFKIHPTDILDERARVQEHYGPGAHPGTGSPQAAHGGGGSGRGDSPRWGDGHAAAGGPVVKNERQSAASLDDDGGEFIPRDQWGDWTGHFVYSPGLPIPGHPLGRLTSAGEALRQPMGPTNAIPIMRSYKTATAARKAVQAELLSLTPDEPERGYLIEGRTVVAMWQGNAATVMPREFSPDDGDPFWLDRPATRGGGRMLLMHNHPGRYTNGLSDGDISWSWRTGIGIAEVSPHEHSGWEYRPPSDTSSQDWALMDAYGGSYESVKWYLRNSTLSKEPGRYFNSLADGDQKRVRDLVPNIQMEQLRYDLAHHGRYDAANPDLGEILPIGRWRKGQPKAARFADLIHIETGYKGARKKRVKEAAEKKRGEYPDDTAFFERLRKLRPRRVREHYGPGAHPSGSPQSVHGGGPRWRRRIERLERGLLARTNQDVEHMAVIDARNRRGRGGWLRAAGTGGSESIGLSSAGVVRRMGFSSGPSMIATHTHPDLFGQGRELGLSPGDISQARDYREVRVVGKGRDRVQRFRLPPFLRTALKDRHKMDDIDREIVSVITSAGMTGFVLNGGIKQGPDTEYGRHELAISGQGKPRAKVLALVSREREHPAARVLDALRRAHTLRAFAPPETRTFPLLPSEDNKYRRAIRYYERMIDRKLLEAALARARLREHYGPGAHPSGSPQAAHGGGRAGVSDNVMHGRRRAPGTAGTSAIEQDPDVLMKGGWHQTVNPEGLEGFVGTLPAPVGAFSIRREIDSHLVGFNDASPGKPVWLGMKFRTQALAMKAADAALSELPPEVRELAYVVRDGVIQFATVGERSYVSVGDPADMWTPEMMDLFPGSTITHLHPSGTGGLSLGDMTFATAWGAKIRTTVSNQQADASAPWEYTPTTFGRERPFEGMGQEPIRAAQSNLHELDRVDSGIDESIYRAVRASGNQTRQASIGEYMPEEHARLMKLAHSALAARMTADSKTARRYGRFRRIGPARGLTFKEAFIRMHGKEAGEERFGIFRELLRGTIIPSMRNEIELDIPIPLVEATDDVLAGIDDRPHERRMRRYYPVRKMRRVREHYGPGAHPGTGTPQSVHGGVPVHVGARGDILYPVNRTPSQDADLERQRQEMRAYAERTGQGLRMVLDNWHMDDEAEGKNRTWDEYYAAKMKQLPPQGAGPQMRSDGRFDANGANDAQMEKEVARIRADFGAFEKKYGFLPGELQKLWQREDRKLGVKRNWEEYKAVLGAEMEGLKADDLAGRFDPPPSEPKGKKLFRVDPEWPPDAGKKIGSGGEQSANSDNGLEIREHGDGSQSIRKRLKHSEEPAVSSFGEILFGRLARHLGDGAEGFRVFGHVQVNGASVISEMRRGADGLYALNGRAADTMVDEQTFDDLNLISFTDHVLNNQDRHSGNALVVYEAKPGKEGGLRMRVAAIDHDLYGPAREWTPGWGSGRRSVTSALLSVSSSYPKKNKGLVMHDEESYRGARIKTPKGTKPFKDFDDFKATLFKDSPLPKEPRNRRLYDQFMRHAFDRYQEAAQQGWYPARVMADYFDEDEE